jgi:Flp pilus assembly protein TadG
MSHEIRNISATGFYLLTRERWHPGTLVTMTLQRSDGAKEDSSTEHYISVLSKVVRVGQDGVGLAFVAVEAKSSDSAKHPRHKPADKRALGRFLKQLGLDQSCVVIGPSRGGGDSEKETLLNQVQVRMPGGNVMKRQNDESGQALIITALCMTCLFGFAALATDVGIILRDKRLLQIAADSAAVAGAAELNYTNANSAAQAAATQNGFTNGTGGVTVIVNTPPLYGPHKAPALNNARYVEVIVSQNQATFFMKFFGISSMTPTARAVAWNGGSSNGCMYTLGTSGSDLSVTGNANISIPTCGIIDDSSSSNALSLNGNVTLDAQSIGIVGGYSSNGNVHLTPATPVTGLVSTSDPLGFLSAPTIPSSCSVDPSYSGNPTATLTAGCYNGLSGNGNINLTLSPGLYIINGNFNLSGNVSLSGTGVTLDLLGSTSLPGNVTLNLTAPTTGTYNGVLIYQPLTNTNALALNGNSGSVFKGIVYAPGAAVTFTGNSGASIYTDLVVKSLALVGNASLNDYASINSSSVLSSVKLVE